jgi:hypothetical protein
MWRRHGVIPHAPHITPTAEPLAWIRSAQLSIHEDPHDAEKCDETHQNPETFVHLHSHLIHL